MIVIVTGVAGAGKTTVGRLLARELDYAFRDADEFHSPANVAKMSSGESLTDADRDPWLDALAAAIDGWLETGERVVLACSALKERYRRLLLRDSSRMRMVYLKVSPETARARVATRMGHFMPGDLVDSQFAALEEPADAIVVDGTLPPNDIVRTIRDALPWAPPARNR